MRNIGPVIGLCVIFWIVVIGLIVLQAVGVQ